MEQSDELSDEQHTEIIEEFICSNTKFEMILSSFNENLLKSPSYYKVLFGLFTSYVCGDYFTSDTISFIFEYLNMLDNIQESEEIPNLIEDIELIKNIDDNLNIDNNSNVNQKNKLKNFFSSWDKYLDEHFNDTRIIEIYDKIVEGVKNVVIEKLDLYNVDIKVGKLLFGLKSFRKILKIQQKQKNGLLYVTNGLFKIFVNLKLAVTQTAYNEYLNAVEPLLEDVSFHNNLVDHINDILDANIAYTYDDLRFITQKSCSSNTFNLFIQKILLNLVDRYNLDTIVSTIKTKSDDDVVHNYFTKLYNTVTKSLSITHLYMLKKYFLCKTSLNDFDIFFNRFGNTDMREKNLTTKEIKKIIHLLDKDTNDTIQKIFIEGHNISLILNNEMFYLDFVTFVSYITSFTNTETFYGNININIFECLVQIIGNTENGKINQHIKYYACNIILKLIKSEGFGSFNNLFENLFKYISSVKFFEWTKPDDAIDHHFKIVESICMLTDYYKKELTESKDIISSSLYILLKDGIKIFEEIHEITEILKEKGLNVSKNTTYFTKLVNVIEMTLIIHQNMYHYGIIKEIYPEVENTYSIFISELLTATLNSDHDFYTFLARPELAAKITKISLASICNHINFCHIYLKQISPIILKALDRFGIHVSEDDRKKIVSLLTFDQIEIDYDSEFLDPILNTPITDPIKIPNYNDIFDKISIITHIHNSKENPYTREPLTIQMLEEYNKKPEIIEEINLFLEKKKQFEENYIKTNTGA